jgi:hypothetical protein
MGKELEALIGSMDKDAIKKMFLTVKSQIAEQMENSKTALIDMLSSDELEEDDKNIFAELDSNLNATATSFGKVIDLIIKKID